MTVCFFGFCVEATLLFDKIGDFDGESRDSDDNDAPRKREKSCALSLGGSSGGGSGDGLLLGDESLPSLGFGSGDGLALESGFGELVRAVGEDLLFLFEAGLEVCKAGSLFGLLGFGGGGSLAEGGDAGEVVELVFDCGGGIGG